MEGFIILIMFPIIYISLGDGTTSYMRTSCTFGLCSSADDYPEEEIKALLKEKNITLDQFDSAITRSGVVPLPPPVSGFGMEGPPLTVPTSGGAAFDADISQLRPRNLCNSIRQTQNPKIAKNLLDKKVYIVNVDGHTQRVIYEICNGERCALDGYCNNSNRMKRRCQQQFIIIKLMALSEDKKSFTREAIRVPSYCICVEE